MYRELREGGACAACERFLCAPCHLEGKQTIARLNLEPPEDVGDDEVVCPMCSPWAASSSGARYASGARVLVKFDDGIAYPGTVQAIYDSCAGALYTVLFDDGEEHDDVVEEEMAPEKRRAR